MPFLAISYPEAAGAALDMMIGIPTLITFISISAGILPLYVMYDCVKSYPDLKAAPMTLSTATCLLTSSLMMLLFL